MNLYRIATTAELADGTARDDVFDVEADAIAVSRSGGIRAWVERPAPAPAGRWDAWVQRRRLARDPHAYDELTCWVPGDSLVSARKLTPPETTKPGASAEIVNRTGGVIGQLRPDARSR